MRLGTTSRGFAGGLAPIIVAGCLALPGLARAQFNYTTNDGTITITGYNGPGVDLIIPGEIFGLPVTAIGNGAFERSWLTSLTMPNSITTIGNRAFFYCSQLTTINLPDSLTTIGSLAFGGCSNIKSIQLPGRVTEIPWGAFASCYNLNSVTIPNSLHSIGPRAFIDCASLTNVIIPSSVTNIGEAAFSRCTSFTSVKIPNSVTSIGEEAFCECPFLTAIEVEPANRFYSSLEGVLFNANQTELIAYPAGNTGGYDVPSTVTTIGNWAFSDCHNLSSITLPNGLLTIGDYVFYGCSSLTNIIIPDSVTTVGDRAFSNCSSLTSMAISKRLTEIGEGPFILCSSLGRIEVDPGNPSYSSLDGVLFNKSQTQLIACPWRKTGFYSIPETVTMISDNAFFGCSSLSSITLPNGITSIGFAALQGCMSITNLVIPDSVTSIGQWAVSNCRGITSITIPGSVTDIGHGAFFDCSSLTAAYFESDGPGNGKDLFSGSAATIYYLPGTKGWGASLDQRPTAPWVRLNPVVLRGSVSTAPNALSFRISWATNVPVVVEASETLRNPTWSAISTNTLVKGWTDFTDASWANYSSRFYRVRSQ